MGSNNLEKEFDALEVALRRWAEKNNVPLTQEEAVSAVTLSELIDGTRTPKRNSVKNSRCVSVDTISPAPDGRRGKNESFKGKTQLVKFRCTTYEKSCYWPKPDSAGCL